ncbi:MAG: hypothetical protein HRF45_11735 [Fimbriimonadia bacterium]
MRRMTLAQILAGGIVLAVLIATGLYLLVISPTQKKLEYQNARNVALEQVIAQRPQAENRVRQAKEEQAAVAAEWASYIARKSPPTSVINLDQNRWRLTTQFRSFRNKLQADLFAHMRKTGVRVLSGPTVPGAGDDPNQLVSSYFNYPTLPYPCAILPIGTMQVSGTFSQILQHVEAWNRLPNYIALTDGLQLSGTSPNLVGTYSLLVLVFPRGEYINDEPVPWFGSSADAGGVPMGMPGMGGPTVGPTVGPGGPAAGPKMLKGR